MKAGKIVGGVLAGVGLCLLGRLAYNRWIANDDDTDNMDDMDDIKNPDVVDEAPDEPQVSPDNPPKQEDYEDIRGFEEGNGKDFQ